MHSSGNLQEAQLVTVQTHLSGWKYRALTLSVVVSAIGYLGFSMWGGWDAVAKSVKEVGMLGVVIALLMSSFNYLLRFVRWQIYLKVLGHAIPWRPSLKIYLAGFALTTTPGKAGEALRGVLLKPWGVPYRKSFAAFFSERLSDLIGIVLLTFLGLTLYPDARPVIIFGAIGIGIILVILSQQKILEWVERFIQQRQNKLAKLSGHLIDIFKEAQRCHKIDVLALTTLLAIISWGAEAVAFYWILTWMGADVSLQFATFVYALAMLAGAVSFMPGGLGGTEAVMVTLLIWNGMHNADAVAATVLIRLATLWFAVAIGSVCLSVARTESPPTIIPPT
nr:lysylphosphatidylglycerol synthase transmembrane domain-containing protein [uncultured Pseudomonas sp.]